MHSTGHFSQLQPAQTESTPREPIAIVGIGCRYPGAHGPSEFWQLLANGHNAIREIPKERFDIDAFHDPRPQTPGKLAARAGGFLDGVFDFDADYFRISPREASRLDPQQRLLLEVCAEALDDAYLSRDELARHVASVYVGCWASDWECHEYADRERTDVYSMAGSGRCLLSGRVSFAFDLRGPSLTVDTGCSASLIAAHLACQSLWLGESSLALVGGVNLIFDPKQGITFSQGNMLAQDGQCKAFDARADGFSRSDGCGVVVLMPLSKAQAYGARVYALIRGSGASNDGFSNGLLTTPSEIGQEIAIRAAYRSARWSADDVQYVEAHGTGTRAGDPVELRALAAVMRERSGAQPCLLGSVKTNIGHTEGASGVAGLIKVALAIQQRTIPGSLHFQTPTPLFDWSSAKLSVASQTQPWPAGPARAGVSSFGISGTDVHMLLEEMPLTAAGALEPVADAAGAELLVLSGAGEAALRASAAQYRELLQREPAETGSTSEICWSAALGRRHHDERLAAVGGSRGRLLEALDAFLEGESYPGLSSGRASAEPAAPVFVFSGQGSQWDGMGLELLSCEPVFRQAIEACDAALRVHADWSLLDELTRSDRSWAERPIDVIQPTIFALQVALAALWRSFGVEPALVVGHSMGEVAAAHVAGVLGIDDAARIICLRSRNLQALAGQGGMLSVELPFAEAEALIARYVGRVGVAASNSPHATVLSGDRDALRELAEQLRERSVFCRELLVDAAAHSPQLDPLLPEFARALQGIQPRADAALPICSTVSADLLPGSAFDAAYWVANQRQPVRFSSAVEALVRRGHARFIEVSPHPILLGPIQQILREAGQNGVTLSSMRRGEPERAALLGSLGQLHNLGQALDLSALFSTPRRFVPLPAYPFQRERFDSWPGRAEDSQLTASGGAQRDALTLAAALQSPLQPRSYAWLQPLSVLHSRYLADHAVAGAVMLPGAAYIDLALQAAQQAFGTREFRLEDASFATALILDRQSTSQLQIALSLERPDLARVQFYTRSASEPGAAASFTLHASVLARRTPTAAAAPAALDRAAILARCQPADPGDHFAGAQARGIEFGPAFRGMRALFLGEREAFAELELPNLVPFERGVHAIHAVLLDACWQSFAACLFGRGADPALYLPVGVRQVLGHGAAELGTRASAHARLSSGPDAHEISADVCIYDELGQLQFETRGLTLRRVASADARLDDSLYALRWIERALPPRTQQADLAQQTWLVLADRGGVAHRLVPLLEARGATCVVAYAGAARNAARCVEPADREGVAALVRDASARRDHPLAGVIDLWPLDAAASQVAESLEQAQTLGVVALAHVMQGLSARAPAGRVQVWVVTRSAQAVLPEDEIAIAQAPLWAFARVLRYEFPEFRTHTLDLSARAGDNELRGLLDELVSEHSDDQIALRGQQRRVLRLLRDRDRPLEQRVARMPVASAPSFELLSRGIGVIDNLSLQSAERPQPGPHEIEIEVAAAGVNFIDVMKALGIYPGLSGAVNFGGECAGTISALGSQVEGFHVGQRVVTLGDGSRGCFCRFFLANAALVAPCPSELNFEQAATMPAVFVTADYALRYLGRLARGERVLIHSATGGVGLAAIQIARRAGAEIFATAGSEAKRAYLHTLGIEHVFDSRSSAFAAEIMQVTRGEGVDVVLNSLSGQAIYDSLSLLRDDGRFLEIGKRDIYEDAPLGMLAFKRGLSFSHIDILRMARDRPAFIGGLLRELLAQVDAGELRPLHHTLTPVAQAADALRAMARAQHIGKVVLSGFDRVESIEARADAPLAHAAATYLITGGLGGLGLQVAQWLVEQGARHLLLLGRSEPKPQARALLEQLRERGVEVTSMACDVSRSEQLERALAHVAAHMPPLRGVVHAAAVLDDGVALTLTPERFAKVMGPKLLGAFNLHAQTAGMPLDFFVLFSSAAAALGSPGQGNYASGNEFMDALAELRRKHGLPALSIDWGPWRESGIAARADRAGRLSERGMGSLSDREGLAILEHLLRGERVRSVVLPGANFATWVQFYPTGAGDMLEALLSDAPSSGPAPAADGGTRSALLAAPAEERPALLEAYLVEVIRRVLRIPASKALASNLPLNRFGIDSLMAVELKNRVEADLGVVLPVSKILLSSGVSKLALDVSEGLPVATQQRPGTGLQGLFAELRDVSASEADALLDDMLDDDVQVGA
jgi:phthiocerol/phenolphthiocerol synthesis type-I polyketide synthase C